MGSPAIDFVLGARTPTATCISGELDQRGAPRADGINAGGTHCDLGAFEYASNLTQTAVTVQTQGAETQTNWLPVTSAGLLATVGAWVMRRKYH